MSKQTNWVETFEMDADNVKSVTGGGRLKMTTQTDDGLLVILYVPVERVRENIDIAIEGSGKALEA